jgi:hypothetical protein
MKIEPRLGGNHSSASDSRLEAIDWARGGCEDHFGLFRASLQGQAAELEASAGQLAPLLKALLYSAVRNQAGPVQPGHNHGGPYGAEIYIRGTSRPLSLYTRRRPHLQTHREETPPTRSEEEQTVVMICRPNSKRTPLINVYLIYVLCSLFFAPLCTDFNFN